MSELDAPKVTFWRLNDEGLLEEVDKFTGDIVNIERMEDKVPDHYVTYADWVVDLICERVANGEAITNICRDKNMPAYSTFANWRREYESCKQKYEKAVIDRGDAMRDKAIKIAMEAKESGHERLKVDTLKWAAQSDNPSHYNTTKKAENNIGITQIVIETGIRREGDEGFFKDESVRVVEEAGAKLGETESEINNDITSVDSGSEPNQSND